MMLPRGFKTKSLYHQYVTACEDSLYREYERQGFFTEDESYSAQWTDGEWLDNGIKRVVYKGVRLRTYFCGIFDIKDDECGGNACRKCQGDDWTLQDDAVQSIGGVYGFHPMFPEERVWQRFRYDPELAATRSHP